MNDNRFTSAPAAEAPVAEMLTPRFPSVKSRLFSRGFVLVQSLLLIASSVWIFVLSHQLRKDARTMEENSAIIIADGKRINKLEWDEVLRREIPELDILMPPLNTLELPGDFDPQTGGVWPEEVRLARRKARAERLLNLWLNDVMKHKP